MADDCLSKPVVVDASRVSLVVCRRMSSSSESGFNSDMSDDSPAISTPDDVNTLRRLVQDEPRKADRLQSEVKEITQQLVVDVVSYMTTTGGIQASSRHSATLLRVVSKLSSKHKIVFESIVSRLRLGVNGKRDTDVCRRTFTRVMDELFADGRYNWGRIVTVFAFTGWLAQVCQKGGEAGMTAEDWSKAVVQVAGEYIVTKLSSWVCQQGGWDAMIDFFAEPESFESKMWRGLVYALVSLGVLATMAAVVR